MSKRLQGYETAGITVTFDPAVCVHSGACVRGLPSVFDVRRKRWVRPEAATPDQVAAQIERCPSGALQPVAHILLQVGESVSELVENLVHSEWNARPAGVASAAFHVRHITGVIGRLFTYARGEELSPDQFAALRLEGDERELGQMPLLRRGDAHSIDARARKA